MGSKSGEMPLSEMIQLKRWNTPTIYNGWEQVTTQDLTEGHTHPVNKEPTNDYMPQMGPMVGRAVTVLIEPSNAAHKAAKPDAWTEYRKYLASVPGPKVVIVQDLDKPRCAGAFWGEVNSSVHKALGCVGTIIDGAIRDVDEMTDVGFKALARQLCVGHAHSWPISWGEPVEVFGQRVEPGQLVHADKHGFIAIPKGEESGLLDASQFMDRNECETLIPVATCSQGQKAEEIIAKLADIQKTFGENVAQKFKGGKGEF